MPLPLPAGGVPGLSLPEPGAFVPFVPFDKGAPPGTGPGAGAGAGTGTGGGGVKTFGGGGRIGGLGGAGGGDAGHVPSVKLVWLFAVVEHLATGVTALKRGE